MWILLLALLAQDFEAIGRVQPVREDAQAALASGLGDSNERTRAGAARGFEALFRLNKGMRPVPAALTGLHAAFSANRNEEIRELILMAMNTVQDRDAATLALALKDPSPQVRRLAVLGTGKWIADPSPIVQYAALKADPTCDRAAAAVANPNGHVVLLAIDLLGKQKCDAKLIAPLLTSQNWRTRAHALLSMAAVDPVQARRVLRKSEANPVWQVRAYAAKAAIILNDSEALATLARDPNPNVAIEAMTTFDAAVRALSSDHSGLIRAGANKLKDAPDLNMFLPQLVAAYRRLTGEGVITRRDPRVELLNRIGEVNDPSTTALLRAALHDQDPKIAALAAKFLNEPAQTTQLPVPPAAPAVTGAKARITMRGLGVISLDLLDRDAPATVATFVQLAEAGMYNGLTFHRIVPNFVIQGGSPGADEYDALSRYFMPDELGVARNARGTVGISTRGRDTGDAQIYFNLVDNFHLDRNYTVFAATREGLDVMDRVQEGDVIEKIEIIRARR
jgi:cyclophilin family peptidyl-prolyl cis-trans isomerase